MQAVRRLISILALAAIPAVAAGPLGAQQPPPKPPPTPQTAPVPPAQPGPRLVIESFAPARAFAIGMAPVAFVGTVRNAGTAPQPAGPVAKLYALSGLDYFQGDTRPKLPDLAPNATQSFRWQLQPTAPDSALVAGLTLDVPDRAPEAKVAAVQHFPELSLAESASVVKLPEARVSDGEGLVQNATIRARVVVSPATVPVLLFSVHTPTGWRRAGASLPLAEVLSAEGGQRPWWELLKGDDMRSRTAKGEASLTITGGVGLRWRATLELTVRLNSSVMEARLLLAPLRPVKLSGIRMCPYLAGAESFGSAVTEVNAPAPPVEGGPLTGSVTWGEIKTGGAWPQPPALASWSTTPLPDPAGADYHLLGTEMRAPAPVPLTPASLIEIRARLFAYGGK